MQTIGKKGEDIAVDYLKTKGFQLVARNYRYKRGEVDLIATIDGLLVFVEVKFRSRTDFGEPETFVSANQQNLIIACAENYTYENKWERDIRFDIIAITESDGKYDIKHLEDAFY